MTRTRMASVSMCTGGLLLRESALSTILERGGKKRTAKGIAYTQIEGDQAAYGSRKAKVYGADQQMEAWDANARLIAPLCCAISPPQPKDWRAQGEYGDPEWLRKFLHDQQVELSKPHSDEVWARRKLEKAASSALAEAAVHAGV